MRKLWCKFVNNSNLNTKIKFVPVVSNHAFVTELVPYVLVNNRILSVDNNIVVETYGLLTEIFVEEALISTYLLDVELAMQWQEDKQIIIAVVGTSLPYVVVSHTLVGEDRVTNTLDSIEEVHEHVRTYLTLR